MIRKFNGVAVAVLALFAAAGAQAQSSVKLYGTIDLAFASIKPAYDPANKPATPSISSGLMTTSYIGFSGSEDLGGGLKAEFALESFVGADDGSNVSNNGGKFWSRASNIALSSASFGKVALGQYDNPLFTFGYTYDAFGSSMAFAPTMRHYNYIGQTGYGTGFDTGWVNSVTYETPNFSGFTGVAQYALKETNQTDAKNGYSLAGFYNAGPLSVGATYTVGAISNNPGSSASAVGSWLQNDKVWALGASYDFGVVKAFANYSKISFDKAEIANVITDLGGKVKDKVWSLGVSVPVTGSSAILAAYGQAKGEQDGFAGSTTDKVLSLAYDYTLSKRTDVYAGYMNNKQTDLKTGNSFALGIRHNF